MTPKQKRFIDEYIRDLNATKAAVRAGYSAKMSNKIGPSLLSQPEIRIAVAEAMAERSRQTGADAAWVLRRLVAEVEADLSAIFDRNNCLLPVDDWPEIWRQGLIVGVETITRGDGSIVRKVRLSDRLRRLELIGKHVDVSAFSENVSVRGVEGLADRLARASQRVADMDPESDNDETIDTVEEE